MERVQSSLLERVAGKLAAAGHQVYLVGGAVRDRLLCGTAHDLDLVTDARPARIRALLPEAVEVGASFGVMLVRSAGEELQLATYRAERGYADGRHPDQVVFETEARADVVRRDFSINALLEDPFTGEIIDYVGGLADLRAGLVRAIGDAAARFAEDHLRVLRAVRLTARLGFTIEPATWRALCAAAPLTRRVSTERVRDELSRILTEGGARRGFELLEAAGLLEILLPEVARLRGVEQPPDFHPEGDVWKHTLGLLERLPSGVTLELALAALLHDIGKPATQTISDRIRFAGHDRAGAVLARAILTRLRYSNHVIDTVESMVAQHMKFREATQMTEAHFKRFVRQPGFDTLLELHRLDLLGGLRPLANYDNVRQRRAALGEDSLRPPRLVTGNDLIALGYQPGPLFTRVLAELEEGQLEGRVTTREEALRLIRQAWERAST
jgi:poly(A) polymerase